MQTPLEIGFHNMDPSDFVEARVRERVAKLEKFFDRIVGCRVVIEAPHRQHRKGNLYNVHIEVRVPGTELVINKKPGNIHAHQDIYVAIRDAFEAMERKLAEHARRLRQEVKTHETPVQGRVARLFANQGYGFIVTTDGREIYFHKNSVLEDSFDRLEVGQAVQLAVIDGESPNGPQATTVRPIGELRLQP